MPTTIPSAFRVFEVDIENQVPPKSVGSFNTVEKAEKAAQDNQSGFCNDDECPWRMEPADKEGIVGYEIVSEWHSPEVDFFTIVLKKKEGKQP